MTRTHLSTYVPAPIDEVFDFFDDPDNTLEFSEHAENMTVVDVQGDGRRTTDVLMKAGRKTWMQTVEQVVRQRPTRLTTRGGTWTTDRERFLLAVTTDLRFSAAEGGTQIDLTSEFRLQRPWRHPFWALLNRLQQGATKRNLEYRMSLVTERIASRPAEPS